MARVITALCNALPLDGVPSEICYIPEGKQRIFPQSHPKGVWVNMPADQGQAIAAKFDGQLQELLKANVKPWIDFEHTGRFPSAGRPTAFRYEPGKGLMCAMDWSRSGKEAIEGKDVNYFSPRVDIDERGIPVSLPKRGPLGGLVTEPAFRDMPAIAANQADDAPHDHAMNIQILASCGLLTANEAALEGAESLATSRVTALKASAAKIETLQASVAAAEKERDDWKKKFEDAESARKADKEKDAKEKVAAAVAAGQIAPNDHETQQYFVGRIVAGDDMAKKMLENLPELHPGIDKPITAANGDGKVKSGGFEAKAQALVTAGQAKTIDDAIQIVASTDPKAYDEYLKTLG